MMLKRSMRLLFVLFCIGLAYPLAAREIAVKYRQTPVDVSNGKFQEISLKLSSVVEEIFYDSGNQYLLVSL